jgi:hypothetical protein
MAYEGTGDREQVTGRVASVNPAGLKLDGSTTWVNFSKYATDLVPPERGQYVTLTLDRQGFIRAVAIRDGSEAIEPRGAAPRVASEQRDRTITRLAVLKAAAEFGAARPQLKSGDVLAIAAVWERWIHRDQETTFDLRDEF